MSSVLKNRNNSKHMTVNILNMKRAALTDVLLVGLKQESCDATREHHLEETKGRHRRRKQRSNEANIKKIYQREKDKCKKKRKAKTEERKTVTNQPIVIHAYYMFYLFHPIYNIYYSSYHDQLVLRYTFFHSIDF